MQQLVTFDTILTNKVGFAIYQIRTIVVVALALCINGFTEFYQLQTLEVLHNQEQYDQEDLELLSSAQFLGMTAGYLLQTVVIDALGRRKTFIASEFINGILLFGLGASHTLAEQIIFRFGLGTLFALIDTSVQPLVCEVVPADIRGKMLSMLNLSFVFGIILNGIGCWIFWDSVDSGNITILFFLSGMFAIVTSIAALLSIRESPRFLMSKQEFESGFTELNLMGFVNRGNNYTPITNEEEAELKLQFKPASDEQPNLLSLFDPDVRKSTFILWLLQILQNIMDKGFIVIIPFILKDSKLELQELPILNTMELFSPVVALLIIDRKAFGRKRGLQIGYIICLTAFMIMYQYMEDSIIFCITLQRFAQRLTWIFMNVLTMESYGTRIRSLGYGISNCIGKCAGTLAPFIFIPLYFYKTYWPFILLAGISFLNFFLVDLLPSELTQKPLDLIQPAVKQQPDDLPPPTEQSSTNT